MQLNAPVDRPTPAPIYLQLRGRILSLDPAEIGLAPEGNGPRAWAVLMEMVLDGTTVTLVSVADGSTSLYFSNGGGIIGSGDSPEVATATRQFIAAAGGLLAEMEATDEFPLPGSRRVRFYVLTHDGAYTAEVPEQAVQAQEHVLMSLYAMGQDVITQIRLQQESNQQ